MRRVVAVCALVFAVTPTACAFDEVSFELIGSVPGVNWDWYGNSRGVDHIAFISADEFCVWDRYDRRAVVYNRSLHMVDAQPMDIDPAWDAPYTMIASSASRVAMVDRAGNLIVRDIASGATVATNLYGLPGLSEALVQRQVSFVGDLVVYEDIEQRRFHTFQVLETEDGIELQYRNSEDTRSFIESTYHGNARFHYDAEGYLFQGMRLATANPLTFNEYFSRFDWYDNGGGEMTTSMPRLVGVDAAGNYYWNRGVFIMVYSVDGHTVAQSRYPYDENQGRLQIDPYGNIYVLSYGGRTPGELDLLWIQNDWATVTDEQVAAWATGEAMSADSRPSADSEAGPAFPADATVVIPSSAGSWGIRQPPSVVVRTDPEPNAAEVSAIPVGTRVGILDRTTDITQIGVLRAPWYLIETEDGVTGWILGSFLERD